jgi:hypothetical protein
LSESAGTSTGTSLFAKPHSSHWQRWAA